MVQKVDEVTRVLDFLIEFIISQGDKSFVDYDTLGAFFNFDKKFPGISVVEFLELTLTIRDDYIDT